MDNSNFLNRKDGVADNLFIERWSPRSFSPEPMKLADLKKLIDAARWSPSTLNEQPWVFLRQVENPRCFKILSIV